MYTTPTDRIDDEHVAFELLRAAPFMHLISTADGELLASSIPMLLDEPNRRLVGHVARANSQWRSLDRQRVLVIATPSDGYVSPSWYPSKQENGGRVVPTWNYETVHVHGSARLHDDAATLRQIVDELTRTHEAQRTDGSAIWSLSDAPEDFIDRQLRAIVGVSVAIDRLDAKRKLSSNRSAADQAGVRDGLARTRDVSARLVRSMSHVCDEVAE